MPRRHFTNRAPGQNRGRPRLYTPEVIKQRQRDQLAARKAAWKAEHPEKLCAVVRCREAVKPLCDYCSPHHARLVAHGSPLAGPLPARDVRRMTARVLVVLTKIEQIDAELVTLAFAAVERIVVAPGHQPVPPRTARKDVAHFLAVELHRLQHPPAASPAALATGRHERHWRTEPVDAREAFVAIMSAWLTTITPNAISGAPHGVRPVFDSPKAIAMAVGRAVLMLRLRLEKTRCLATAALGSQLVEALAPMLSLMQSKVLRMMARGEKRAATIRRKRGETLVTAPVPEEAPTGPPVFTF